MTDGGKAVRQRPPMVHQRLGNGPVNRSTTEQPARRDRQIAARRTPVEEGVSAIEAFAKTHGVGKDATLTLIFAGRIATIDTERSRIIAGIKRYAKRQRRPADRIRDLGAGLKRYLRAGRTRATRGTPSLTGDGPGLRPSSISARGH